MKKVYIFKGDYELIEKYILKSYRKPEFYHITNLILDINVFINNLSDLTLIVSNIETIENYFLNFEILIINIDKDKITFTNTK